MKIHQLSVFVENKPGHLAVPCRLLADSNINIATLSLADTQRFGILRMIVRDWKKAKDVLEQGGFAVNLTEVLAVEVLDQPGGLAKILDTLDRTGVNVEYMYAFAVKANDRAVLVFRFDDSDLAAKHLAEAGISVLSNVALYDLLERA